MSRPRLHELLELLYAQKGSQLLESCLMHSDFSELADRFNLKIPVQEVSKAFVHTSFSHEFNVSSYEQLEFLGDAVLSLILTDELYRRYPNEKEGKLSKLRSAIVNEGTLALMAKKLGFHELILVGRGEFKKNHQNQDTTLADTLEAFLGQIYRFHGLQVCQKLFLSWLIDAIPNALEKSFIEGFDVKSKLQEMSLAKYKKLPQYVSNAHGSDFEVQVWINDKLCASGIFSSKKIGEKQLATEVLEKENF